MRPAREYWDNQWMQTLVRPWAVLGQEPFATHLKADPDEPVQTFRPQDISVVVVGGESGGTYKMLAGSLRDSIVKIGRLALAPAGRPRRRRGRRPTAPPPRPAPSAPPRPGADHALGVRA